jgi:hypothetical protein
MKITQTRESIITYKPLKQIVVEKSDDEMVQYLVDLLASKEYAGLWAKRESVRFDFEDDLSVEEGETFFMKFVKKLAENSGRIPEYLSTGFSQNKENRFYLQASPCLKTEATDSRDEEMTYSVVDYARKNTESKGIRWFSPVTGEERKMSPLYKKRIAEMDDLGV